MNDKDEVGAVESALLDGCWYFSSCFLSCVVTVASDESRLEAITAKKMHESPIKIMDFIFDIFKHFLEGTNYGCPRNVNRSSRFVMAWTSIVANFSTTF